MWRQDRKSAATNRVPHRSGTAGQRARPCLALLVTSTPAGRGASPAGSHGLPLPAVCAYANCESLQLGVSIRKARESRSPLFPYITLLEKRGLIFGMRTKLGKRERFLTRPQLPRTTLTSFLKRGTFRRISGSACGTALGFSCVVYVECDGRRGGRGAILQVHVQLSAVLGSGGGKPLVL